MFAIKRTDGKYVSKPGSAKSYTNALQCARVFRTREEAEADRCPGNEYVVAVHEEMNR